MVRTLQYAMQVVPPTHHQPFHAVTTMLRRHCSVGEHLHIVAAWNGFIGQWNGCFHDTLQHLQFLSWSHYCPDVLCIQICSNFVKTLFTTWVSAHLVCPSLHPHSIFFHSFLSTGPSCIIILLIISPMTFWTVPNQLLLGKLLINNFEDSYVFCGLLFFLIFCLNVWLNIRSLSPGFN